MKSKSKFVCYFHGNVYFILKGTAKLWIGRFGGKWSVGGAIVQCTLVMKQDITTSIIFTPTHTLAYVFCFILALTKK